MPTRNYLIDADIHDYVRAVSLREPEILTRLRAETEALPKGSMQITPETGQLLRLLIGLTNARTVIELGTFTGYSALSMALALPEDGRVIACDGNTEALEMAKRYWSQSPAGAKISLHVGEISETLPRIVAEFGGDSFDFAFIDADKPGYASYFETCIGLLRPGGLMVFDNTLMGGEIVNPRTERKYVEPVRAFNLTLLDDPRVDLSLLPIADGLTLARKR